MRNFSIHISHETENCIASIDGYEAYRITKSQDLEDADPNFIVECKSEVDSTWGLPEDNDGSGRHDEFMDAICEIFDRFKNDSLPDAV